MGLQSYTQLRDDEDSLKRKRTALTNIMRSLFKVRFLVLSAAALLTLCVFVAYNTQSSSIKAMSVPAPSNILRETSKSAEESLAKDFDLVSGSCDHVLADLDIQVDVDDLDNLATPEMIMLSAVSGEGAQDR